MASRLMSAYGNLAQAKTNIGRNLSDIAGIGIEMEYGKEGRISGQMAQQRIANQTAAIGLGLEGIQKIAGLGISASEEAARAKEMGELAGGYEQTKGETRLWDLFRGKAKIDKAGGETFWGEVGERIGTGLGFMDREYEMGGKTYTSSQIETGIPYARLGKNWEEVSGLMGGRMAKLHGRRPDTTVPSDLDVDILDNIDVGKMPEFEDPLHQASSSKYANMTFGEYLKSPNVDQSLVNKLMSKGWSSATDDWQKVRGTLK